MPGPDAAARPAIVGVIDQSTLERPFFDPAIAAILLAHAQALETAELNKDPEAYAALIPQDYTEISSQFTVLINGRDAATKVQQFARGTPHQIVCSYITNPRVQVFDDVAVLVYISLRFVTDREGRSDPACRRATRIYALQDKEWRLTHSHFSSFDYRSTY